MPREIPHEIASGYLQVARRTRATYRHSNKWKPFAGKSTAPYRDDVDAESALQIRSSAILRLLAPEQRPARGRALGGSRTVSRRAGAVSGTVAFTLATTLQDVLRMLFPANAHRIAVLCPQSRVDKQHSALEQFASERQPSLRVLDAANQRVASLDRNTPDHGLSAPEVGAHAMLAQKFFDRARSVTNTAGHEKTSMMLLFVIEDSDHDLGVAKAVAKSETFETILAFWRDYVSHCVETSRDVDTAAYAFGAGKIADIFDLESALDILNDMSPEDE